MTDSAASVLSQGQGDGAASGGGSANSPWYGEIIGKETDADFKAYVQNKNYPSPLEAIKGHYNAEKLIGLDRAGRTVVLPKDDNDAEGRKAFYAKIGVPDSPDGYKLDFGKGSDVLAKAAAKWFHDNGVPQKSAAGIASNWTKFIEEQMAAEDAAEKGKQDQELNLLRAELGNKFDAHAELSRRAFKEYAGKAGLSMEDITAIESDIGTAKTLKLFMKMGETLREAEFAGGEGQGFGATPDAVRAKIKEIQTARVEGKYSESDWNKVYMPQVLKLQEQLDKL